MDQSTSEMMREQSLAESVDGIYYRDAVSSWNHAAASDCSSDSSASDRRSSLFPRDTQTTSDWQLNKNGFIQGIPSGTDSDVYRDTTAVFTPYIKQEPGIEMESDMASLKGESDFMEKTSSLFKHSKLMCHICGSLCGSRRKLYNHIKLHIKKQPYSCILCKKRYVYRSTYMEHMKNAHFVPKPFTCKWCAKVFSHEKIQFAHIQNNHEKGGNFQCQICLKKFKKFHNLQGHVNKHYGEKLPFRCQHCGRGFSKQSNLKSHIRCHTGERPYQCNLCPKTFAHLSTYTEHVKRHFGSPYICSVCGKQYKDKMSFDGHMTVHTGIKPFKCKICGKEYGWRTSYKFHIRYAHKISDNECKVCGQKFKMKKALEEHEERHQWPRSYKPFECGECNQKFTTRGSVYRHLRIVHHVESNVANHIIHHGKPSKEDFDADVQCEYNGFTCPICTRSIRLRSSLLKHVRSLHKIEVPTAMWSNLKKQATLKCQYMSEYGQYACSLCHVTADQRIDINRHLWMDHEHHLTKLWDEKMTEAIKQCKLWKETMNSEELTEYLSNINAQAKLFFQNETKVKFFSEAKLKKKRIRKQRNPNKILTSDDGGGTIKEEQADEDYIPEEMTSDSQDQELYSKPKINSPEIQFENPKQANKVYQDYSSGSSSSIVQPKKSEIEESGTSTPFLQEMITQANPQENSGNDEERIMENSKTDHQMTQGANQCPICNNVFETVEMLKYHMKSHPRDCPFKCRICGKSFSSRLALKRHEPLHADVRPHVCDICGKGYTRRIHLRKHMGVHTGDKMSQCPQCGKYLCDNSSLKIHLKIHAGDLQHKCPVCSKAFATGSTLRKHLVIHSGEKPYRCKECGRGFSQHGHLTSHMRIHTGDRPYKCDICTKSFTIGSALKNHVMIHTDTRPWECSGCDKKFRRKHHLREHLKGNGCPGKGSYEEALKINEERMSKERESKSDNQSMQSPPPVTYDSDTDEYEYEEEDSKSNISLQAADSNYPERQVEGNSSESNQESMTGATDIVIKKEVSDVEYQNPKIKVETCDCENNNCDICNPQYAQTNKPYGETVIKLEPQDSSNEYSTGSTMEEMTNTDEYVFKSEPQY